jgi:hypothetical protein
MEKSEVTESSDPAQPIPDDVLKKVEKDSNFIDADKNEKKKIAKENPTE